MKINIFSKFFLRFFLSLVFFYFLLLIYQQIKLEIRGIDLIFLRYAILGALVLYLISEYKTVVKAVFFFFDRLKSNISIVKKPTGDGKEFVYSRPELGSKAFSPPSPPEAWSSAEGDKKLDKNSPFLNRKWVRAVLLPLFFFLFLLIYQQIKLEIRGINLIFLSAILGALILYLVFEYKAVVKLMFFCLAHLKSHISAIKKPTVDESKKVDKPSPFLVREHIKPMLFLLFFFLLGAKITLWSLYFQGDPFNILTENFNQFDFLSVKDGELIYKDVISGKFKARENNLGIVSIRFDTYDRPNTDYIGFKIRDEEEGGWDYHTEYFAGQFQDHQFFPFGFPKVNNSKNKNYIFEIASLRGKNGDAVGLSKIKPNVQIKYEFTVGNLFSKPLDFFNFVFKKIVNLVFNSNFVFNLLIYFLPLLLYLLLFVLNVKSGIAKAVSITAVFLFIAIDTFLLKNNDFNFITLTFLWLFLSYKFDFSGRLSVLIGLVFLLFCPFFLLMNNEPSAEKVSIWAYLFIIAGTVLIMLEERRLHEKKENN